MTINVFHFLQYKAETFTGAYQPIYLVSFPAWILGAGALAKKPAFRGLLLSRFIDTALPC